MAKPENIKIPLVLFNRILYLLDCLDLEGYDEVVQSDYDDIVAALTKKKQSLELHDAYAKLVYALDDDSRDLARINYLQRKQAAHDDFF